jgi:hypothetical protein
MGNQASNSRTTGMILAQYLPEEYPQRNKRRINSVEPGKVQCFHSLLYRALRQNIRERQFAILQELSL